MPTSWSIAAAHSSSRSSAGARTGRRSTSESNICSASSATCSDVGQVGLVLDGEVVDRGLADVVEQRLGRIEQRAGEEHALAQPGLGHLDHR